MNRVDDVIVSCVIGAGCVTSLLLFHRIAVYPIAVATALPATAAITYVVLRVAGMRSPAPHAQEPITLIALHVATFVIGLHLLMVCTLAGVWWAHALGPRTGGASGRGSRSRWKCAAAPSSESGARHSNRAQH